MSIGGFDLPAGARAAPCGWLLHRRHDIYPDPDAFRPERFLEAPPGTYTWIPFGGGTRRCLGASFSMFEMKHVLRAVVGARRVTAIGAGDEGYAVAASPSCRPTTPAAPAGAHAGPKGGSAGGLTSYRLRLGRMAGLTLSAANAAIRLGYGLGRPRRSVEGRPREACRWHPTRGAP